VEYFVDLVPLDPSNGTSVEGFLIGGVVKTLLMLSAVYVCSCKSGKHNIKLDCIDVWNFLGNGSYYVVSMELMPLFLFCFVLYVCLVCVPPFCFWKSV
jgi:hypothetical protein